MRSSSFCVVVISSSVIFCLCSCPSSPHPPSVFDIFKGKPDLNTSLPVRQTASIFKQPVTKVTNHPNNKVKTDPQKAVDQPRQVNSLRLLLLTAPHANLKHTLLSDPDTSLKLDEPDPSLNMLIVDLFCFFCCAGSSITFSFKLLGFLL